MSEPLALYGRDLFGDAVPEPKRHCKLADDFLVPPFSVLNAREGWWQERKRAWIALGIKSELGRGEFGPAVTEGSGGPGTLDGQRREWRDEDRASRHGTPGMAFDGGAMPYYNGNAGKSDQGGLLGESEQATAPGLNHYRDAKKNGHTASLKGGLTVGTTTDPYRVSRQGEEPSAAESGTSIFDPVICELAYRWFCPVGGQVLDPFAGGSVRGLLAHLLGRSYWGCDLRPEQVAANEAQAALITPDSRPVWVCGDAVECVPSAPEADFVFSCPPYGDLERYSDDPRDLSTMDYPAFMAALRRVVAHCYCRLRADRFACFVVGEFRDGKGHYRNFVGDTVSAFQAMGFQYYNEAILVTMVGSLPIRVTKQFNAGRKLGKTHQQVLVFVKGDAKRAAQAVEGERQ
jgi:hypothetical protein